MKGRRCASPRRYYRARQIARLCNVFGIFGKDNGFKLSLAVGEMVAELVINGKRAESDVNTFRYSRFAENQPVRGMYDEGLMG